jgi:hypothetical protein
MFVPYHFNAEIKARLDAQYAKNHAQEAGDDVVSLRNEIERLLLITEGLWHFIKTEHGYSDQQLMEKINDIDLLDGKLDGRKAAAATLTTCPACKRRVTVRRPHCLYCGADLDQGQDPFAR